MFNELKFVPHRAFKTSKAMHARHKFPNGYAVSVISGAMFRSNGLPIDNPNATFEVAIMNGSEVVYDTPITIDGVEVSTVDVLENLSADAVSQVMKQVSEYDAI